MQSEKRKEARSAYLTQPSGKMQVLYSDKCLPVASVKDVSPTGIRLEVKTPISIGENIEIRYVGEKVDIKLNGTVVWNSVAEGDLADNVEPLPVLIGIKLVSPSLLQLLW
jgi:hypothetical protein